MAYQLFRLNRYTRPLISIIGILMFFIKPGIGLSADIRLITPTQLHSKLTKMIILDARPKALYLQARIPGSLSFYWEDYTHIDERHIPYRMLPPEHMANLIGSMGIDEFKTIAVYGDANKSWGGEGWICWLLSYLGHQGAIFFLEGGMDAWTKSNRPVDHGPFTHTKTHAAYHFQLNPAIDATLAELKSNRFHIVDTRSILERWKKSIPGSVHINWEKFHKGKERIPLSKEELTTLLLSEGVGTDKPVIYYCEGGIRSAFAWLVHTLLIDNPAKNFEGGMVMWEIEPLNKYEK